MLNKVNIKDVKDAIEYLWTEGFVDEMTRDKRYLKLEGIEDYYNG
jgi:hypothetical protein